jgi:hypothetical protein
LTLEREPATEMPHKIKWEENLKSSNRWKVDEKLKYVWIEFAKEEVGLKKICLSFHLFKGFALIDMVLERNSETVNSGRLLGTWKPLAYAELWKTILALDPEFNWSQTEATNCHPRRSFKSIRDTPPPRYLSILTSNSRDRGKRIFSNSVSCFRQKL